MLQLCLIILQSIFSFSRLCLGNRGGVRKQLYLHPTAYELTGNPIWALVSVSLLEAHVIKLTFWYMWSVAYQPYLGATDRGSLRCASASPRTSRSARLPSLPFCDKCSWGDLHVGHLGIVGSTGVHKDLEPSTVGHFPCATPTQLRRKKPWHGAVLTWSWW